MEANLPRHLEGAAVYDATDLLVDAGVPSDTLNAVCRGRRDQRDADTRIAWAVGHFQARLTPFSWWVGPTSRPADLGERLGRHGLRLVEVEEARALDLSLCWPRASSIGQTMQHDGQASCAHTTMILSNNKEANDMRSPRVFFDAVASGHGPSHRLSAALHEYPRCCILMRYEEAVHCC